MTERYDRLFRLYNASMLFGDPWRYTDKPDVSEKQLEKWIIERLPVCKEWVREQLDLATRLYGERMDIIEQAEQELNNV